jgi:hypothetical protein
MVNPQPIPPKRIFSTLSSTRGVNVKISRNRDTRVN